MPCTVDPVYSYHSDEEYYLAVSKANKATRAYCELLHTLYRNTNIGTFNHTLNKLFKDNKEAEEFFITHQKQDKLDGRDYFDLNQDGLYERIDGTDRAEIEKLVNDLESLNSKASKLYNSLSRDDINRLASAISSLNNKLDCKKSGSIELEVLRIKDEEVLKLKDKNRKLEEMNLLLQKRLVNLIHYTAIRLNDKGEDFLKNFFAINKPDLLPFLAHQKRLKDLRLPYFTVDLVGNWTLVDNALSSSLQRVLYLTEDLSEEDKLALIERLKG